MGNAAKDTRLSEADRGSLEAEKAALYVMARRWREVQRARKVMNVPGRGEQAFTTDRERHKKATVKEVSLAAVCGRGGPVGDEAGGGAQDTGCVRLEAFWSLF